MSDQCPILERVQSQPTWCLSCGPPHCARVGATVASLTIRNAARQSHREHRALARLARHRHVPAHHARELAGDCKAEPGAAELLRSRGIGLAELLEQLRL